MSPLEIAIVVLCSCVGFTLQGAVGFGMGILGSPIFVLIDTRLVPGPVLVSTMLFTTMLTIREHRAIDLGGLRWAVAGRIAGTIPAAALLALLSAEQLRLLFGGIVLLAVAISVSGVHVEPRPASLLAGGVLSGIMGTIAAIGGPPMALLYQHAPGARVRGTLSGLFLVGTVISLTALVLVGRFGLDELRFALLLLPGVIFGFFVSRRIASRLDRGYTRPAVLTVAAAAGLIVVVRYFTV
ncbi:MAG: hypothetical protein CL477_16245 [Acidobacteria bacterium]|jgi:hypothetical protein|nr:hypothetical protein [Acidobacteriota bacterium]MDP7338823.1 sulfite exporter TauE/SafE family protein [Vicinamibacterales bacterium]